MITTVTLRRLTTRLILAVLTIQTSSLVAQSATPQLAPRVVFSNTPLRESSIKPYSRKPSSAALKWADKELKRMSLDEKIGQLVALGLNATYLNQDSEAFKDLRHQIVDNHVGGIVLFRGPVYESVLLVNRMQELAKYPLLISSDLEAGPGMRFDDTVNFPWNMAVGATANPEYAWRQGELTAREARALGIQQIYAPVADVNNNAANPVINVRSYGEDPESVAKLVAAFVQGAQHGAVMDGHIGLPLIDPTVITPLPRDVKLRPIETTDEIVVEKGTMPTTLSPV